MWRPTSCTSSLCNAYSGMSWRQALLRAITEPQTLFEAQGNADALKLLLMRLCAVYLTEKRATPEHAEPRSSQHSSSSPDTGRPASSPDGGRRAARRAVDQVAHFHFANGAMLESVHWRCVPRLMILSHLRTTHGISASLAPAHRCLLEGRPRHAGPTSPCPVLQGKR
jgi:hypothetical protein